MSTESSLVKLEETIKNLDYSNSPTLVVMMAIRQKLRELDMSQSYRDQMVASMTIEVTPDIEEEQLKRMCVASSTFIEKTYVMMHDAGFNDQAIALAGVQMKITLQ